MASMEAMAGKETSMLDEIAAVIDGVAASPDLREKPLDVYRAYITRH